MSATKPRGKNWSPAEDEALCKAWLEVSQDSIIGTNQRTENLYARIFDKFLEICTESGVTGNPELRAPSGIKSRWHAINKSVSKFAGCLAQVNSRPQSGASPEDNIKKALALYASAEKAPFIMMNCFRILESAPKWQNYQAPKVSAVKRPASCPADVLNDLIEETGETGECSSRTVRPKGRDASKKQKTDQSVSFELAKSGRLLAEAAQAKLKDAFQRTQALKRIANHSVMSMDLTKLTSEVARKFYEIEQQRILEETMKETRMEAAAVSEIPETSMEGSVLEESEEEEVYQNIDEGDEEHLHYFSDEELDVDLSVE